MSSHDTPKPTVKALHPFLLFPWGQISTPTEEVAYLHVSIQGGSLGVSQQREVLLKAPGPWTVIQTDKTTYAPGQTGEGQEMLEELMGSGDGMPRLGPRL